MFTLYWTDLLNNMEIYIVQCILFQFQNGVKVHPKIYQTNIRITKVYT